MGGALNFIEILQAKNVCAYIYIYIYIEVRGFPARGILSLRTLDWGATPQKGLFRVRLLDILDDFSDLGLRKMILRCRGHVWL